MYPLVHRTFSSTHFIYNFGIKILMMIGKVLSEWRSTGAFEFLVLQVFIQTFSTLICGAMVEVIKTISSTPASFPCAKKVATDLTSMVHLPFIACYAKRCFSVWLFVLCLCCHTEVLHAIREVGRGARRSSLFITSERIYCRLYLTTI